MGERDKQFYQNGHQEPESQVTLPYNQLVGRLDKHGLRCSPAAHTIINQGLDAASKLNDSLGLVEVVGDVTVNMQGFCFQVRKNEDDGVEINLLPYLPGAENTDPAPTEDRRKDNISKFTGRMWIKEPITTAKGKIKGFVKKCVFVRRGEIQDEKGSNEGK